jgi:hypothetical protein
MALKPRNPVLPESTAVSSRSLWKISRPASASKSNVHLCQPAGARFTPSQNNWSNHFEPSQAEAV